MQVLPGLKARHLWLLVGAALAGCNPPANEGGTAATGSAGSGQSAQGAAKKTFLVGVSQPNKGEPWRQAMYDQIAAAAKKHPELNVVYADAQQNNSKQIADVEGFLTQGIDLLIISPNEAAPLTDVVSKAYDKGVPVILLDRKINGDKYTMWIGGDNKAIGQKAGKFAADWCQKNKPEGCDVLEVRGLEGSTPTKERGDGFRAGLKSNPKARIVAAQSANWLRERAVPVSQAMLQANPDADVVYGHNDPMAEAAFLSAESTSKKKAEDLLLIGIDGLPTPDGGLKSVAAGRLDATYVYPTGGAQAIEHAVKILEDKAKVPKSVVLQTEEVTKGNAAQVLAKYAG